MTYECELLKIHLSMCTFCREKYLNSDCIIKLKNEIINHQVQIKLMRIQIKLIQKNVDYLKNKLDEFGIII